MDYAPIRRESEGALRYDVLISFQAREFWKMRRNSKRSNAIVARLSILAGKHSSEEQRRTEWQGCGCTTKRQYLCTQAIESLSMMRTVNLIPDGATGMRSTGLVSMQALQRRSRSTIV
jgi:hypothetical protein